MPGDARTVTYNITEMSDDSTARTPITLSICIPTYSRSETVCALVRQVLQCPAQDIEVVVLDNGSTDGTLQKLAAIRDARLSVYSNGENRGVLFNVLNVMLKGRGRYSALLLDKDSLDPARIESFKQFLLTEQPACGFSRYHGSVDRCPDIAPVGVSALQLVGYAGHHPTGYFFRTDLLHELNIAQRFSAYDYVGHFPFDFILAECSLRGPAAIYQAPAFAPESLTSASRPKSFGTNAAKEDAFFSPKGRLKMAVNFAHHIRGLPVPSGVQRQLILDRLAQGMFAATLGYSRLLRDEHLCAHYHIATRNIGTLELVRTGLLFYRSFFQACLSGEVNAEVRLSHYSVAVDWMLRLTKNVRSRLARRLA